ncbi:ABC-2 type transport system permease protein [Psychromicrobium silvestre]|uniref:ABC-2 type transport system permease protein n=1 Tax=Psychromicrobium silvestre TaxID=1645614 RepID=A0A7Y9LSH9_9MICC|nr:transporter [Psychromicrobium silvestre]NYE94786.1 ABC-2 type transport system permease protein [Psychromicrobium silvestre]
MVAHLIGLKLAILRNSVRRSTAQLIGMIFGALYGLAILALMIVGLIGLAFVPLEISRTVIVLAGAALILAWLIVPLFTSGLDMTLDPERFVTFAVPMRQLLTGLACAAVLGIPGIVTLLASLGTVATWLRNPLAAVVALFCAVLGVATCVLGSRALTSLSSNLAASRKFRDLSFLVLLIPLMFLGPMIAGISQGIRNFGQFLPGFAETISFTPLGAVWSVPADIVAGQWWQAGVKFLIALATAGLLAWLWRVSLARALVTPVHTTGPRRAAGKLGFFRRFPATPWGAVAARSLSYFFRDPRYAAGFIIAPILPLVFAIPAGLRGGNLGILAFAGAISAFLLIWSLASDTSYDNTAFALHVSTGVSGLADRWGRAFAYLAITLTLGLLYAVLAAALTGSWAMLPGQLGLVLGIAFSGVGLGSVTSAFFIFNVPAPGDSPFKSRPGNNFIFALIQMGGLVGLMVLVLPELILTTIAVTTGQALLGWISLLVGVLLGGLLMVLGLRMGGRVYERRAPELLALLMAQK